MLLKDDVFPNFELETTKGNFKLYDYIGDSWCVFYAHTQAFTPICTSDLASVATLWPDYVRRNLKAIALTLSSQADNMLWQKDIMSVAGLDPSHELPFPIISDFNRTIAQRLGMIHPKDLELDTVPKTVRHCFLVGPDKKLECSLVYPDAVGRNYAEIIRIFDALTISHAFTHYVGTPANWVQNEKVLVLPNVNDQDIPAIFPKGFQNVVVPSGRNYLKLVDYIQ